MANALTGQQRKFVEIYSTGVPAGRAYEQAGYVQRGVKADSAASRLLTSNDKVKAYLAELKEQSKADCRWTKKRALDYLADIMETPIGEIGPDHELAQEYQQGTEATGEKIKMPAKLDAFDKMAKMCDWYAPEKHEHEAGGTLAALLGGRKSGIDNNNE